MRSYGHHEMAMGTFFIQDDPIAFCRHLNAEQGRGTALSFADVRIALFIYSGMALC
jgi:hypothetical protein